MKYPSSSVRENKPECFIKWDRDEVCDKCAHQVECIVMQHSSLNANIQAMTGDVVWLDQIYFQDVEPFIGDIKTFSTQNDLAMSDLESYVQKITNCPLPNMVSAYCKLLITDYDIKVSL